MNGVEWLSAILIIAFAAIIMVALVCSSIDKRTSAMQNIIKLDASNIRKLRED